MKKEKIADDGHKRENNRQVGSRKELVAKWFLQQKGYEILGMNYRCYCGEIDLIGKKDGYLVFIEVKYRSTEKNGSPGGAVSAEKQRRISKVARQYLYSCGYSDVACRFDVVEILGNKIRVIENAFGYRG